MEILSSKNFEVSRKRLSIKFIVCGRASFTDMRLLLQSFNILDEKVKNYVREAVS